MGKPIYKRRGDREELHLSTEVGLLSSHIAWGKRFKIGTDKSKWEREKRTNADSYSVFELNAEMYLQYKRNMETGMAF